MFLRCPALFSSTLSLATYVATKLRKKSSRDREKSKQDRACRGEIPMVGSSQSIFGSQITSMKKADRRGE